MPFEGVKAGPPPPKDGPTVPRRIPEKRASGKQKAREEAANGIGQLVSFGFMLTGNLADAGAMGVHWPNIAHELAAIAENDPKMARGLDYLLEVGPYGNLIVVALPLVGQILANHKMVKPEALAGAGVVHPEALEADVKRSMAESAAHALRMQQEAEEQLARLHAEMNGHADAMRDHVESTTGGQ